VIVPGQAVKVLIATKPVDFRKGHDGLAAYAEKELGLKAHSGVVVVFRSRRADRIKILVWVSHCHAIGPSDNGARAGWC